MKKRLPRIMRRQKSGCRNGNDGRMMPFPVAGVWDTGWKAGLERGFQAFFMGKLLAFGNPLKRGIPFFAVVCN